MRVALLREVEGGMSRFYQFEGFDISENWSPRQDSNLHRASYEEAALPIEPQGDQQTIYPSNGEGSRGLPATAQRTVSEPPSAFNNLPPGTSWRRTQGAALASIREFDWHLSENGVCPRA